ncbi:MAG: hypothetical protein MI920_30485 [Kiloniellales bacterium]|nr:hypothetical protein [Kiloniellales bacterium]
MAKRPKAAAQLKIKEGELSKGQLRKLNALRKSLGQEIADKAFSEWLTSQPEELSASVDKNALMIADALQQLRESHGLRIRRGGYLVMAGRGRTIVEPMQSE